MKQLQYPKSLFHIPTIWLVPVLLILIESAIFITKAGWGSHNVIYYVSFWIIRVLLTPAIIIYTQKFWVEHTKKTRLIVTHLVGFILFSLVFTTLAYLSLYTLLSQNDFSFVPANSTKDEIYVIIADNSISINTMVYLSTVVICYIVEYSKRAIEANKKAFSLEKMLSTTRLDFLKNQLNTHFLFNTLHTINSLVTRGATKEAGEMLIKLSDLLRFTLRENEEHLIPLRKELFILQTYIDLMQFRLEEKVEINVEADEDLYDYLVPSFVLQPLVENAIKHAVEPMSKKGNITISVTTTTQHLNIVVTDNGEKQFSESAGTNGIGLKNCTERLKKLYGTEFTMSFIPNQPSGLSIRLQIPLKTSGTYESESINS